METTKHNNLTDSLRMAGRQTGNRAACDKAGEACRRSMQKKQAGEACRRSKQELPTRSSGAGNMPWDHFRLRLFVKYSLKEAGEIGEKWPLKDIHIKSLEFVCECDYIWRKGLCRCE